MIWQCPNCGTTARVPKDTPRIYCFCGYKQLNGVSPGLGDMVSVGLAKIGITAERYTAAKAAIGLKRRCGCHGRQRKLNAIGHKLGIGLPDNEQHVVSDAADIAKVVDGD